MTTASEPGDKPKKGRKWVTTTLFIVGILLMYQGAHESNVISILSGLVFGGLLVVFMGRDLGLWWSKDSHKS